MTAFLGCINKQRILYCSLLQNLDTSPIILLQLSLGHLVAVPFEYHLRQPFCSPVGWTPLFIKEKEEKKQTVVMYLFS